MIGMAYSLILSEMNGEIDESLTNEFIRFASANGYPFGPVHEHSFETFMAYMQKDKKASFGKLNFVLLQNVGSPYVKEISVEQCEVTFEQLKMRTEGNGMTVRGLRGATTVIRDNEQAVLRATEALVKAMARENDVLPEEIISVIISTTSDIMSAFPAKAVRTIEGWKYVPVMCTHEMDVPGSMPLCIRILMHANTTIPQKEIAHIYQNEAVKLRPDLQQ